MNADEVALLNSRLSALSAADRLGWAWDRFGPRAALGTSLQGAGLVMLDLACSHGWRFPVFTLDTGLLFPETLELLRRVEAHFGIAIERVQPARTVDEQAGDVGPELWARDPDACCRLRKVEPLGLHLSGYDCWISGIRRDQGASRAGVPVVETIADSADRLLLKLNPLADWTREAVQEHLLRRGIPVNPLQALGYRSIGCRTCTRPTTEGQDERAGRWTGFQKTECGIHLPAKT